MKKIICLIMALSLVAASLPAQNRTGKSIPVTVVTEVGFGMGDYLGAQGIIGHQINDRLFTGIGVVHYEHSVYSVILYSEPSYSYLNAAFFDARYSFGSGKVAPYAGADLGFGIRYGKIYGGAEAGARIKVRGPFGKSCLWVSFCGNRCLSTDNIWAVKIGYSF